MVLAAVRAEEPDVEQVAVVRGCSKGQILLTLSKRGCAALLPLIRVFTGGHGGLWACCWPPGQAQRSREMVTSFFWNAVWDRALCTEFGAIFGERSWEGLGSSAIRGMWTWWRAAGGERQRSLCVLEAWVHVT